MSRRKKTGWFSKVVKVVASVSALLAWAGHLMPAASGAIETNKPKVPPRPHHDSRSGELVRSLEEPDVIVDTPDACPLQKPVPDTNCERFYMLVSTIDGKVSALDLHKKGSLAWSVPADSTPLYSSSLASMEMVRNGKKMRLIPSLDGALYQFDGEKVEAVPMSAETLLSSTYRLGDDTMVVGSKDLRNFGISLRTGEILYTCSREGCSTAQGETKDEPFDGNDILVITRNTQTVRSVDIKNGQEKWNFSVGQHQASLPPTSTPSVIEDDDEDDDNGYNNERTRDDSIPMFPAFKDECPGEETSAEDIDYEDFLRLLVPEGRIVALNKGDSSQVSWEHKFDSPIAKAWLLRNGKLEPMSLFDGRHIPSLDTFTEDDLENESMPQPLLYIGSHQKLLYIQASPHMEAVLKTFGSHRIGHYIDPSIEVSWRPYLNTASARTPILSGTRPQIVGGQQPVKQDKKGSTSLTVWHEDYPFDTGYFLYPEFRDSRSRRKSVMLIEDLHRRGQEKQGGLIETLPETAWVYWKEIVSMSMVLAFLIHVMIQKVFRPMRNNSPDISDNVVQDVSRSSNSSGRMVVSSDSAPLLGDQVTPSGEYISRFANDFEILHCLGKGGFGIVFEAVNRVDDQHYAVKRTMLPKSEGAKEKVLREVRALAKLEHVGIVRYFNAWVESPPAGWQEERDKQFQFSGVSGPTSQSNTASYTEHKEYRQQDSLEVAIKKRASKKGMDTLDIPSDLKPGIKSDPFDTDSVVFASDVSSHVTQLKQSGSGEFSVHSNLSTSVDRSDSRFTNFGGESLSFGLDPFDQSVHHSDSANDSRSSIPFSNYTTNSSQPHSQKTEHSDQDHTGDSVVFESTGNGPSSDSTVPEGSKHSMDDSIVFADSLVPSREHNSQSNALISGNKQLTIDIYLSSHQNDGDETKEKHSDVNQPNTNFFLYIQMQLYRKETLKEWLSNNTLNRDRNSILDIFDQIICAVDYVHSQGLMHRDLKPSNIFFTEDGLVKVGDFGLVTALCVQQDQEQDTKSKHSSKHTAEVGTTMYMSPEQIAKKPYDLKIDVFSLGLIFLELWIPFSTQMERIKTLQDAKRQIFPERFLRELPEESELVRKMTSADPALRPTTEEILAHPLFVDQAPHRYGTRHRRRTISDRSSS